MFISNSRIELVDGIRFYEQDILYDDYIYTGDCQIDVDLDYYNNGFGILLINSNNKILSNVNSALLFRLNHKSLEVIYKENSLQKIVGVFSYAHSITCTDNLQISLRKIKNKYTMAIGGQIVCDIEMNYDFENYHLGFYSNQDNTINYINVAGNVPYGWIVNMRQTNGGYIDFHRDGFELSHCKYPAEIEQIKIKLTRGEYYLKYDAIDSDVKAYIMLSDDEEIYDDEKNILRADGSFIMTKNGYVSLKFKGTTGRVNNIAITTSKFNDYVRTSPDYGDIRMIEDSYLKLNLLNIKEFVLSGCIINAPGTIHSNPSHYSILKDKDNVYGLFDLNIAEGVYYDYIYSNHHLWIRIDDNILTEIDISGDYLYLFNNVNGKITNFVITDFQDKTTNITVENTIKQYVPAVIKSPIVILDKNELPLELSSSYRYYYKDGQRYYWFTNTEREYFKPAYSILLEDKPLDVDGTIIVYGIRKDSKWELDRLLEVEKEGFDSLNACADLYDIIFEENLRYINKNTGEIRLDSIDDYQWIVVDYLKDKSYCLNYRYDLNSYEVDISVKAGEEIKMIYDNVGELANNIKFINEVQYVNTKISPTLNGYITIGGGTN
jgi:hypothetical protein